MRVVLLLTCCLLLSACTGSSDTPADGRSPSALVQPAVTAFAEGTCRQVAEDVLELGRRARELGDGGRIEPAVVTAIEQAQTNLRPLVEAAEPSYKPALMRLVVASGLIRLEASLDGYQPDTGQELRSAYDAAVLACTGTGSAAPATPDAAATPDAPATSPAPTG